MFASGITLNLLERPDLEEMHALPSKGKRDSGDYGTDTEILGAAIITVNSH